MTVLFPPVLEAQGPAFRYYSQIENKEVHFFEIRFAMPGMVAVNDIGHIQVSLKYANTGEPAVNRDYSPDGATLFINPKTVGGDMYFYQEDNGNYVIRVPYYAFGGGLPMQDQTYLVQVRFGLNSLWQPNITGLERKGNYSNFSNWRQAAMTSVPSLFGEWSNLQKVYCYIEASHYLGYNLDDFMPELVWDYKPVGDDPVEQIKVVYQYKGLHGTITKSEVFNGQYQDDNVYSLRQKLNVAPVTPIAVSLEAVTKNNTLYGNTTTIPSIIASKGLMPPLNGKIKDKVLTAVEQEDGALAKEVSIPTNMPKDWSYNVYRINTLTLDCIKIIDNEQILQGETLTFKDYTVEMGEDYQYAIGVVTNKKVQSLLTDIAPFGPSNPAYGRLMRMDCSYLVTRGHQLRLQGNVTLSGLKRNTNDTFQTTIGSQYPFYSRNSQMNYRSFTLGGLITVNFDPTGTFMRLDGFGRIRPENLAEGRPGDKIDEDRYRVLVGNSPGVGKYFMLKQNPQTKEYFYEFIGKRQEVKDNAGNIIRQGFNANDPLDQDEIENLVNKCCASLIMNGMWWDSDDGSSYLIVQDRDLIGTEEFSLSRRRTKEPEFFGEELVELGKEDPEDTAGPKSIYGEYLNRQTKLAYGTNPTDSLVFVERKFREKVMEWLSDGKPKLFRSETEGNMIVMVSGASFTPYDKTSRMVYSVSMTITEIAAFNTENLFLYNLVPTYIESYYSGNSEYDYVWGQLDKNVVKRVIYQYSPSFDIPNMKIGDPSARFSVETLPYVKNLTDPQKHNFTSDGLPLGFAIDGNGVLYGYPSDALTENVPPGKATLTVIDTGYVPKEGETDPIISDTITINYGWMYTELRTKRNIVLTPTGGPSDTSFIVGNRIPNVPASEYHTGGVGPYSYFGTNLPPGISVDPDTGAVGGTIGSTWDKSIDGTSYITVRDSVGQQTQIEVEYNASIYALSFTHLDDFDYDYTEVGQPIPRVDLNRGVLGGDPGYKFAIKDAPKGFKVGDGETTFDENGDLVGNGIIYGVPEESTPGGSQFTAIVTDTQGETRSILISYAKVLEEFKFTWKPGFDITRDATGNLIVLQLQSVIRKDEIPTGVTGGLPYPDGTYRFSAAGLLPNFGISKLGEVSGTALTAKNAVTRARILVTDARGITIDMTGRLPEPSVKNDDGLGILIGEIVSDLKFRATSIVVENLREGRDVTQGVVFKYTDHANQEFVMTDRRIQLDWIDPQFLRDYADITLTLQPQGINGIKLNMKKDPTTQVRYWEFEGASIQAAPETTVQLVIQDNYNHITLNVPVTFRETAGILRWPNTSPDDKPVTIQPAPDEYFEKTLNPLYGGLPPFNLEIMGAFWADGSAVPADIYKTFKITPGTTNSSRSGWLLSGTMPTEPHDGFTLKLRASSNDGQTTSCDVVFIKNVQKLKLSVVDFELQKDFLIKNLSDLTYKDPLGVHVVQAENGYKRYHYGYGDYKTVFNPAAPAATYEVMPGIILDSSNGYMRGIPTQVNNYMNNVRSNFFVVDLDDPNKTVAYLENSDSWFLPRVYECPAFGDKVTKVSDEVGNYEVTKLAFNVNYQSDPLFKNLVYPNFTRKEDKPLPLELFYSQTLGYEIIIEGIVGDPFDPITCPYTLLIKNTYCPDFKRTVNVIFKGAAKAMRWELPYDFVVPAAAYGEPYKVAIGEIVNGVEPFTITYDSGPAELHVEREDRKLYLVGTFTSEAPPATISITVKDAVGAIQNNKISFNGASKPITIGTIPNVPDTKSGDTVSVNIATAVSGGVGTLKYYAIDPQAFEGRGYNLKIEGLIEGTSSEESFGAKVVQIRIVDEAGVEKIISVNVGKITGQLTYTGSSTYEGAATSPLIPGGSVNQAISYQVDLKNFFEGEGASSVTIGLRENPSKFKMNGGQYTLSGTILRVTRLPSIPLDADGLQNCIDDLYYIGNDGTQRQIRVYCGAVTGPLMYTGNTTYGSAMEPMISAGSKGQTVSDVDLTPYIAGNGSATAYLQLSGTSNFRAKGGSYAVSGKKVINIRLPNQDIDDDGTTNKITDIRLMPGNIQVPLFHGKVS